MAVVVDVDVDVGMYNMDAFCVVSWTRQTHRGIHTWTSTVQILEEYCATKHSGHRKQLEIINRETKILIPEHPRVFSKQPRDRK